MTDLVSIADSHPGCASLWVVFDLLLSRWVVFIIMFTSPVNGLRDVVDNCFDSGQLHPWQLTNQLKFTQLNNKMGK